MVLKGQKAGKGVGFESTRTVIMPYDLTVHVILYRAKTATKDLSCWIHMQLCRDELNW